MSNPEELSPPIDPENLWRIDPEELEKAVGIELLPDDAAATAERFAVHFESDDMREPLNELLITASTISDLDGVGLAAWDLPYDSFLWIYGLSDMRTGTPENPSADVYLAEAYDAFIEKIEHVLDRDNLHISTALIYLDMRGTTMENVARFFPNGNEQLMGVNINPSRDSSLSALLRTPTT